MANQGANKGRRLRLAISRFASMLIEEARDLTGLSYAKLDEALGLEEGSSYRYSLYPPRAKTRAPQAGGIQALENRVAAFLRRPAHKILIESISPLTKGYSTRALDLVVGEPHADADYRSSDATDLELSYEYDWPDYGRLSKWGRFDISRLSDKSSLVNSYAWQWGILWDRDILPTEWTRKALNISDNLPVEHFLPELVRNVAYDKFLEGLLCRARRMLRPNETLEVRLVDLFHLEPMLDIWLAVDQHLDTLENDHGFDRDEAMAIPILSASDLSLLESILDLAFRRMPGSKMRSVFHCAQRLLCHVVDQRMGELLRSLPASAPEYEPGAGILPELSCNGV